MSILLVIARYIGFGGCCALLLLGYYEGIPGAHRIPFLTSIPIIGDLTAGRVHTYAAQQVTLATSNMVTKFERDSVQAQLDEERRRRAISEAASAKAQERADATELARQAAEAKLDELEAQARKDGLETWTEEELKWLGRH